MKNHSKIKVFCVVHEQVQNIRTGKAVGINSDDSPFGVRYARLLFSVQDFVGRCFEDGEHSPERMIGWNIFDVFHLSDAARSSNDPPRSHPRRVRNSPAAGLTTGVRLGCRSAAILRITLGRQLPRAPRFSSLFRPHLHRSQYPPCLRNSSRATVYC